MERYPSVKTLTAAFGKEKARAIRAIMQGDKHEPVTQLTRLERIDKVLGTHGVEYIRQGHNAKSPAIDYCNAGDPYRTTVMQIEGTFRVGCWGDVVERGRYD